jgi:hypothetical protein
MQPFATCHLIFKGQAEKRIDSQTKRQAGRKTQIQTERHTHYPSNKQTQTGRETDGHADKTFTEREREREEKGRQTDR